MAQLGFLSAGVNAAGPSYIYTKSLLLPEAVWRDYMSLPKYRGTTQTHQSELPDFGRYLIPLDGQLPGVGASMPTKVPSMMDPMTYQTLDTFEGSTNRPYVELNSRCGNS